MAKAPRPGHCKTRLMPRLTADQAAAMSVAFLGDITANLAVAAECCTIVPYVAYAPKGAETLFDGILAPGTRLLLADGLDTAPAGVEGFGRCLLHAVQAMLALGHRSACVLNADSPTLPTGRLLAAEAALARSDCVVLGAAEDGGYYLLGMSRAHAGLFANIDWSTDRVAAQTRERATQAGLTVVELGAWYDVDDAASLDRLLDELAGEGSPDAYSAAHTASCVDRLGLSAIRHTPAHATEMQVTLNTEPAGATACP